MTLSGYQDINNVVRYSTDGFNFAGTLGDFVGNAEYSYGNEDYKHDISAVEDGQRIFPNARSNIWHTLSALGQDIGEITYSNIKNYIDIVSNIDMCKTRSLISMMKNLGIDYQIIEDINDFPIEVLNLIDIFSIDKKYLLNNDKIKNDLVQDIHGYTSVDIDENSISAYYKYFSNDFQLNSLYPRGKCFLELENDFGYNSSDFTGIVHSIKDAVRAGIWNYQLSAIVYRKYHTVAEHSSINYDLYKIGIPDFKSGFQSDNYYVILSGDSIVCSAAADVFEFEVLPGKSAQPFAARPDIQIKYISRYGADQDIFGIKYDNIDDNKYFNYISSVFAELLSSYLALKYNLDDYTSLSNDIQPIYTYIKDEYLQNRDYYKNRAQLTGDIMEFKRINNIPYSFDEQRIVNNIDIGLDDLDNYDGYIRQLLGMEIDRRARRLTYSDMGGINMYSTSFLSSDNFRDTAKNMTRYSYYRKAKVLEYARFIDNVFALGNIGTVDSAQYSHPYRFDSNRYEISSSISSHIFVYQSNLSAYINENELNDVAVSLAKITQYIAKLRQKVKLQVRKNYMKGTNNLLIYLINEFLVDYSRTNKLFKDYGLSCPIMQDIYDKLYFSDVNDIEVVEYRDDTEYYNLSSARSVESIRQDYNNDFKSSYFRNSGRILSAFDGKTFTLDQIKEFYLSSLGLKNSLSDTTDDIIRFLNSIFEIGQHDSFIDARGNFACRLDDGRFTTELWDELDSISGTYIRYKSYLSAGDYEYPFDTVQNQLTDMVENYIGNKLSDIYLQGISDVYDQHHEEVEHISADVFDISSRYTDFIENKDYALYLNRSNCKYCYTDGEEELIRYKHDWYNDNPDVYSSQYLIDKIGDLKRFVSNEKNIKCYPVLDTLDYVRTEFIRISAELMATAEKPAESYGYMDIMSPFLDEEMRSIYSYLESESSLRKSELQSILANIRQQAQQAKDTYDQLDNTFDSVLANYDTGDYTLIGEINDNYFGVCQNMPSKQNEDGCTHLKYFFLEGKTPVQVKAQIARQKKKLESEPIFGTLFPGQPNSPIKKGSFYRYEWEDLDKPDPNASANYDKLELGHGSGDCTIQPWMDLETKIGNIKTWMDQITSAYVEVDLDANGVKMGNCYVNELNAKYGYANAGVLASIDSIESDLNNLHNTINNIASQINSIGGNYSSAGGNIKSAIDDLQKYLGTDIDYNFSNDSKLRAYAELKKVISQLSAQFDNLKLVYSSMPQDNEYADYIVEAYKSDFILKNIDLLSVYTVEKGIQDKIDITEYIKQLISEYNAQQNLYTAISEQINAQVSDVKMLEPDAYLELQVEYIYKKLLADIDNRTVIAQEHIENDKNAVRITIDPLSTRISSQMSAYEHDFEYYFDEYLSTLNYFQKPEYISAYEIFKTYGGISVCYDPYYNYKNTVHPSFQVHPFLWNFVEATHVQDIVSRSFDGLLNEKLEQLQIYKYIDGIIGEFGQVINIWQNNTTDSTGYTTRYEVNTHTDEDTDYSPVVDYDGGFYPPAVKSYLENREVAVKSVLDGATTDRIAQNIRKAIGNNQLSALDSGQIYSMTSICVEPYYSKSGYRQIVDDFVQRYTVETSAGYVLKGTAADLQAMAYNRLSGTFYQNYYRHLHLDNDAYCRQYIAAQLSCDDIYYRISAIAEDKNEVSDVYDIYRYGLDYQKNMYILYKKYKQSNPTYKERRNTPGALWVRLKHHPIAFPALLSGANTEYQACYNGSDFQFNKYLNSVCDNALYNSAGVSVDFIDIDRYCYDFQFSYDREVIAMPCVNRDATDPIFRTCDYPELVMSIIENRPGAASTRRKLLCFSNNDGEADDVISMPEWIPSISRITQNGVISCPAYLGMYSPSLKNIRLIYAYKNHSKYSEDLLSVNLSRSGSSDIQLMIVKYNEYTNGIGVDGNACINGGLAGVNPFRVSSHEIAFTCDDLGQEKLTFAFPVERSAERVWTNKNIQIDVDSNAEGGLIDDPSAEEITSHDIFDEHIAIVHAHFNNSLFQDGSPIFHNLNADISYQPVYPGYEHKYESQYLSGYENIELLGKSKDISKSIASVNSNVDPYFQLSDMLEHGVYGRVYEDYTKTVEQEILNKTFIIRTNPAFGENKNKQQQRPSGGTNKHYTWYIELPSGLASADIMRMNCVIFNTNNMGKNPYFIGKVSQLADYNSISGTWFPLYYNSPDSEYECTINTSDIAGRYTITGINRQGYTNASDNNRIYNIDAISVQLQLDADPPGIAMWFSYDDIAKEAHIDEGEIRCVFYDDKNIKQFEHYHMLDAYGAINAYEMLKNRSAYDEIVRGDGWKIIYDNSQHDAKFKDKIKSFILDKGTRLYLEDIDLAQYSFLSDVYLYKDNKLAFKYNEEDMFEYTHSEYHYPFLNRKYPNTIAQYYATHMNFNVDNSEQADEQLNIFDESNLFILNYNENTRLLKAMGRIAIPVCDIETDMCMRVFEDYLSVYEEYNNELSHSVSGYNTDRYSIDDPRLFQFTHFTTEQKNGQDLSSIPLPVGGKEVPEEFWKNKTVEEFCANMLNGLSGYYYRTKENENTEQDTVTKYVYVTPTPENCNISDLLNIQVNYRREQDQTLTLFFNYANYINTPFIKYVDGNFKIDTIDRTYLMLKTGESGELDIVIQVKYYIGDTLYGYRNVKMLTFKIHNLSDDKPKFYITKTYELQPDTLDVERTIQKVNLGILPTEIDLEEYSPEQLAEPISCDITFTIDSEWRIQSNSTVEVSYPAHMITPIENADYSGYSIDISQNGVMLITLNNPNITQFIVKFQTVQAGNMMVEYSNRRYALVYGQTNIMDYKNQVVQVNANPGMFMIKNSNAYILADEENRIPFGIGHADQTYTPVYVHSI